MKNRNRWILIGFCGVMVISALVSALRRQRTEPSSSFSGSVPISRFAPRQMPIEGINPARQYSDALANAVEKVMPSVVVIRTEKVGYRKVPQDIFGFRYGFVQEQLAGEGSGVIIGERGYVLTSWHVLEGADSRSVEVVLNNGTKLPAQYIGHDKSADLAVLKITGAEASWAAVEWGDSDELRVGEVVIAIGSPYSFQSSVTVGNVSQKGRRIHLLPYEDFIQTDASITAGNSGGPLIDVDGRLVGINTAVLIQAKEEGVDIGFSTPSNLASVIAKALIEKGYKIPQQVSVCGFDNIFISSILQPPLTTIDHRVHHRAKTGITLLTEKIERFNEAIPRAQLDDPGVYKIEYEPQLIVRNSTGPVKK